MKRYVKSSEDTEISTVKELFELLKSRGIDTTKCQYELKAEKYERYEEGEVYTIKFYCPGDYIAYFSMRCHGAPTSSDVLEWNAEIEDDWITLDDMKDAASQYWWGDGDDYIIYLKNLTTGATLYESNYAGAHYDDDIYDWEDEEEAE